MSVLYANLQKLACWIKEGDEYFIGRCVTECDNTVKSMLDDGKRAEVKEVMLAAIQRMPDVMGFYMAKSCINRGVSLI